MFATLGTQIMGSYLWPWAVACDGEVLQTDLYPKKKEKKKKYSKQDITLCFN